MEKKLNAMFDYQKFEKNTSLAKLIAETENRYAAELSDDDLGFVNAAGELEIAAGTIGENKFPGEEKSDK